MWKSGRTSAEQRDHWNRWLIRHSFIARRIAKLYRISLGARPRVIAVIGSLGKTTTTRAVSAALGLPPEDISGRNELTFVALAVMKIFPWQRHAAIEVGIDSPGQMAKYCDMVRPDVVVVTAVASEHIRALGSLEGIRDEKSRMLRRMSPSGLAVLNGDDPNVMWMKGVTRARIATFGFGDRNDVRAVNARLDWPSGMRFTLHAGSETREVHTRLQSRPFVNSVLAAIAVGLAEGRDLDTMIAAVEELAPTPERLQPVLLDNGAILLRDDFKSSLETIESALEVIEQIPARRKIVVLGEASDVIGDVRAVYRRLGARVAALADLGVFFGRKDHLYASGAIAAGMPRDAAVKAGEEIEQVLSALPSDLGPGDLVLVKGRSSQRLGRVALALMGRTVTCRVASCPIFEAIRCDDCDRLDRDSRSTVKRECPESPPGSG